MLLLAQGLHLEQPGFRGRFLEDGPSFTRTPATAWKLEAFHTKKGEKANRMILIVPGNSYETGTN